MVALIAIAWIACAIIAYFAHTLGTLLLWSIPIPVVMMAVLIIMERFYLDRVNVFTIWMHRRSAAKERRPAEEQRTAVRAEGTSEEHEGTPEEVERLDVAA